MAGSAAGTRTWEVEMLEAFEKRARNGSAPFGDVVELFEVMREQWSDIRDVDVAFAVGRLVREGRLRYALDGIRLVS